jgi:hypothetical protein
MYPLALRGLFLSVGVALAVAGTGCGGSKQSTSDAGPVGGGGSSGTAGNGGDGGGGGSGGDDDAGTNIDAPFVSDVVNPAIVVAVSPATASLAPGQTQQFTATVTGDSNTDVTWSASGGTITAAGLYTAPANGGAYVVRASSVASPGNTATAVVNVTGGGSVVEPFFDSSRSYVRVMTPIPNVTYFAPATIRIWGHAPNLQNDGIRGYSPQVDFYLGTNMVGSVRLTDNSDVDYYEVTATNVPAGSYEIILRARNAAGTVESQPVPITVIDPPATTGTVMNLTSDLMLSGSTKLEVIGTATDRARITSSNGSRIRAASNWTGSLVLRNVDVIGLGSMDVAGIDVSTSGAGGIEITGSVFDRCGPPRFGTTGSAPMVIRGNTFQPNILTPANSEANYAGSHPSVVILADGSAPKFFSGNNVGVSYVRFERAVNLTIGGDTDADSNIIIGVRAGMEIRNPNNTVVRGNFSYHRYPFGWSQGMNLEFMGSGTTLVEHNVFRGGSWMIQSYPSGEFRYNLLVDNINHAFFRGAGSNARIHHNILMNVGYQRSYEPSGGLEQAQGHFYNNTIDAGGARLGWDYAVFGSTGTRLANLRNNVFTGFAHESRTTLFPSGTVTAANYNCFHNPDAGSNVVRYGDSALGANDCGTAGTADPRFSQPRTVPFPIGDGDIWLRKVGVSSILALYRGIYTPAANSPLIDAGDPADDTGGLRNTDIGAVGAGTAHPADMFGRFGQ